jgi:NAD/NADP transhydrogenase beta subunit
MVDIGGVLRIVIGLGVIGIALAIVNLVYNTVVSSIPSGGTTLFDLSIITSAASLVGPLLIVLLGGAVIYVLLSFVRGYS